MAVDRTDLQDLATLGKTPVSSDAPAGADASYDPDYESLQREIDKLSVATAAGTPPDWNLVAHLAAGILRGKSKDLKVAVYLAEALGRSGDMEELALGVHVLRDLVETYWDGLFPPKKRMRGRLNALDWWQERAHDALGAYAGEPLAPAVVAGLRDDLAALDKALAEKAEDAAPLSPLIEAAARLPIREDAPPEPDAPQPDGATSPDAAPQPATPAQAVTSAQAAATGSVPPAAPAATAPQPVTPAQAATPAQPVPAAATSTQSPTSADAARDQVAAGLDLLFGTCDALLADDLASPVPYRLARMAAWLRLVAPPPAASGKTLLPPPPTPLRAAMEKTLASGNFPAAITGAESRLREFRFWLDLSRHTADGLRGLGPTHAAALDAVETETALLLRRFPGLADLRFSDDSPFADAKTKLWLSRLAQPARPAGGIQPAAAEGDDVEAVLAKARELAAANQAVAAAGLLQGSLASARSGRLRLRWRIGLAEILLGSGHPETARPLLDQILADLDAHDLDSFDPELAVSALVTAHQGLSVGTDEAAKARTREVLARIMRLDPAQGLRLSGIQ